MNLKRKIFEFILEFEKDEHVFPTQSYVISAFSGHTTDVALHLEQLEREGLIALIEDDVIEPIQTLGAVPQIRLCNYVPFDWPHPHTGQCDGSIMLDLRGVGMPLEPNMYALYVPDDSMSDAEIRRGDLAFLSDAPIGRGDVVAVEEEGRLVLRRYLLIHGIPHVLAENPRHPDLRSALDLGIHGVLWGVLRKATGHNIRRYNPPKRVIYSDETSQPSARSEVNHTEREIPYAVSGKLSYTDEAFGKSLLKPKAPNRVTSEPWDHSSTLLPEEFGKPKNCTEVKDHSRKKLSRTTKRGACDIGALPAPPSEPGLNEQTETYSAPK